jgi:hypothetical protein
MPQFQNTTEDILFVQIRTGQSEVKIVPGEIIESFMSPDYLSTLGLTEVETKEVKKSKKELEAEAKAQAEAEAKAQAEAEAK